MTIQQQADYVTRDSILKLLSDEEVAQVSTAETAGRLPHGEEYVDLDHLEYGVRRALVGNAPMAGVLPRKAVQEATWNKIVAKLATVLLSIPRVGA